MERLTHYAYLAIHLANLLNRRLIAMWADASKPEEERLNAKSGHVFKLSPASKIFRGSRGSQTSLWPDLFSSPKNHLAFQPITNLSLNKVHPANRAVILAWDAPLFTYYFKVSLYFISILIKFLHTSFLRWVFLFIHPHNFIVVRCGRNL